MVAPVTRYFRRALLLAACTMCALPSVAQPVTQPFTFSLIGHTLPHPAYSTTALGDLDNDGDLDLFLSGLIDGDIHTRVYRNVGKEVRAGVETFLFEATDIAVPAVVYGAAAWADYDGDGDVDLAFTGSRTVDPPYEPVTVIYRNTGGSLEASGIPLTGYHSGPVEWGDVDNDGDLDLLVGGEAAGAVYGSTLYRNDTGSFSAVDADLPGLAYGDAAWGDFDSDGDLDLVMNGIAADGIYADVFRNDGGDLSPMQSNVVPAAFSDVNWGDIDGDGDLDLVQSGGEFSPEVLDGLTRVYENTNASFDSLQVGLPGSLSGTSTWGDYDHDGDLDLFVMGVTDDVFGRRLARVYANEDAELVDKIHFMGVAFAQATWGDVDGDGDLDLVAAGHPTVGDPLLNIYENRRQVKTPPLEPAQLAASVEPGAVTLAWSPADAAPTTSYNLRVGTKPGLGDVVAPMADAATGLRRVSSRGNAEQNYRWSLKGLAPGTYYWSVQAVDAALVGSRFAPENQFTIVEATSTEAGHDELPVKTALHPVAPNPSSGPVMLQFDLARTAPVTIRIHDLLGRTVAMPLDAERTTGRHSVRWDGRDAAGLNVPSGLYICELQTGSFRETVTLIVAR